MTNSEFEYMLESMSSDKKKVNSQYAKNGDLMESNEEDSVDESTIITEAFNKDLEQIWYDFCSNNGYNQLYQQYKADIREAKNLLRANGSGEKIDSDKYYNVAMKLLKLVVHIGSFVLAGLGGGALGRSLEPDGAKLSVDNNFRLNIEPTYSVGTLALGVISATLIGTILGLVDIAIQNAITKAQVNRGIKTYDEIIDKLTKAKKESKDKSYIKACDQAIAKAKKQKAVIQKKMVSEASYMSNELIVAEQELFQNLYAAEYYRTTGDHILAGRYLEEAAKSKAKVNKVAKSDKEKNDKSTKIRVDKYKKIAAKYKDKALSNTLTGLEVTKVPYQLVNYPKYEALMNAWEKDMINFEKRCASSSMSQEEKQKKAKELSEKHIMKINKYAESQCNFSKTKTIKVTKDIVKRCVDFLENLGDMKTSNNFVSTAKYAFSKGDLVRKSAQASTLVKNMTHTNYIKLSALTATRIIKSAAKYNPRNLKESSFILSEINEEFEMINLFGDDFLKEE